MKVRFIGNPADPSDEQKVCSMFGVDFFRGIETDASGLDELARRKLAGNSHFEVTEPEPERRKPGRPRKPEVDSDSEDEAAA